MPAFFFHLAFDLEPRKQTLSQSSIGKKNGFRLATKTNDSSEGKTNESLNSSSSLSLEQPSIEASASSRSRDWRYDLIFTQTINMVPSSARNKHESKAEELGNITNGISDGPRGLATKGRFEPVEPQNKELGWGVVRLYRDAEETSGLYDEPIITPHGKHSKASRSAATLSRTDNECFRDEDCTTLCILAVPSYLTPSDFLGFVGEKTRDEVSHFRMIRTERSNRYKVLMRLLIGNSEREWSREWNGKGFDGMEVWTYYFPFTTHLQVVIHDLTS